jgi:hypothetical protein
MTYKSVKAGKDLCGTLCFSVELCVIKKYVTLRFTEFSQSYTEENLKIKAFFELNKLHRQKLPLPCR